MNLSPRARLIIALAFLGGLVTLASALTSLAHGPGLTRGQLVSLGVLTGLVVASWLWPLVMYRAAEGAAVTSEAVHLDEGFFVLMAIVLPSPAALLGFAMATAIAQVVRRRPLVKSLFNSGQVLTSVGAGLAVMRVISPHSVHATPMELLAAAAGAIVFFVVNSSALAAILAATGVPVRESVLDGLEIRLLLVGASVTMAVMAALAVSAYSWSLPIAVLPLLILRQVLAGHFRARHDRARLRGLFDATLVTHRSMSHGNVDDVLLASARELLRSPFAALVDAPPNAGELSARLEGDDRWLVVSGRSRLEPFDDADKSLLDALAAVGAGALTNAALYEEGRFQRQRLAAITSSLGEGVCAIDCDGRLTFVNPAAEEMLGRGERELTGSLAPGFLSAPALRSIETKATLRNDDTTFHRDDGSVFPVAFTASPIIDGSEATAAVIAFRDITERKAFEEQLSRHAFHDALTGLPNRRLFLDHLDHAIRRAERSNETHAVLFADIDRFKLINDSLGHQTGDQLLTAIADRIRAALRPGDILARFGGDEFTLLLEGVTEVDDAVAAATRMLDQLREPIPLVGGHEVVATLSIGIALTAPGKTRDDILHDADVAMYQAKARGHSGHYEIFDSAAMGARSAERLDLETALRHAIERAELEVHYQPIVAVGTGRFIGAEALVRWNHPERGLLSPAHFIGLAEETGLILPLGRFVLDEACRRARLWRERFGHPLSISVNLSARQFQQPGLVEEIESVLTHTGVDPGQICLEITESLAMGDVEWTSTVLLRLKALGVRVAIDDFGTGYSSLGYLKQFPVDVVKIDRSFVEGLEGSPVDSAIVAAVVGLADTLGMTTVAEGVETHEQLEHLRSLRCPVVQGYYLAKPLPADAVEALLWAQLEEGPELAAMAEAHAEPIDRDWSRAGRPRTPALLQRAAL
jgi:diguanylate cyclase (GGDEF)-like protein/PAS domain S-box-containing protein